MANPTKEYLAVPSNGVAGHKERWTKVVYHNVLPDYYDISTEGVVRSKLGKLLKTNLQDGHVYVSLKAESGVAATSVRVDKLMLSSFQEFRDDKSPEHRNGNKKDCRLTNLVYREPTPIERGAMIASGSDWPANRPVSCPPRPLHPPPRKSGAVHLARLLPLPPPGEPE